MKKFLGSLIAIAIIALLVLRLTGRLGSGIDTNTANEEPAAVAETTGNVVDEVTKEDLDMIEDFLDEIVDAVEKEEAAQ